MAENLLEMETVPDCTDPVIIDWRDRQAAYIRRIVGETPCLRYLPYRRHMVGIDFFACDTLQGASVEVNIHLHEGVRDLTVQECDIIHVTMPDYAKAVLLACDLSRAVGWTHKSRLVIIP